MERDIIVGKTYRHISGNYYRVICIAKDSENFDGVEPRQLVIYESLGQDRSFWSRPYNLFNEKVNKKNNPNSVQEYRFELVDDEIKFGD
jgi:hypothetical protein